mgnify:CR=1 FL=1
MYREDQLKALLEGHRILIAGYGREGRSAERLVRQLGLDCTVADGNGNIADEACSGRYDIIIKSPGIPMRVLHGTAAQVSSLTDLFLLVYGDLTIGVTGTKGKSTTASLIHHLLPASVLAGNIGVPLFDILDELTEDSVVVAELSCHQLENIRRGPHIAVLLNLYQEHLDHYDSYMGYKMAKMQIALKQRTGDHFFFCTDNEELNSLVESGIMKVESEVHPYSLASATADERQLLEACPLAGGHNRSNALVACRVAQLVTRRPLSSFKFQVSSFKGLRHRMEKVCVCRGITWYDDSISTIPEATIAAVEALGRVDTLILGGFDRGIDYTPLEDFLKAHPIQNLVFVGAVGRRVHSDLGPMASNLLIEDDYTRIVPWCAMHTPQGGTVLLSPAASSYDAFKNFEHRGDFFAEQIAKL